MTLTVTWVAGATAAGKTTWIRDRISAVETRCAYCTYSATSSAQSAKIDATYLGYVCANVKILPDLPTVDDLSALGDRFTHLFIEVSGDVDLTTLPEFVDASVERVFIQTGDSADVGSWSTQTVGGGVGLTADSPWQAIDLTGEILDPPSLAMVWTELTQGAYGGVQRAKALFETIEGYPLYFDYVAGCAQVDYEELEITRNLKGRPRRFSGLAVLGEINPTTLQQSLKDGSLDDQLIEYYQAQINQMLATAP